MAKATKKKPEKHGYRLRMYLGQWYIILYDKAGEEIKKEGPFSWKFASDMVAGYQRDGLIDLDRLKETGNAK